MRAVLSGRAALALLNEGDAWHSMSYEDPERLIPCRPSEADMLLRGAHDRIWLEDVSVEQVRDSLADVVDATEALDCVLYLLDGSLQPETLDVVALEFEELAVWPEIVQQVEAVLLAHPFPASADISGAIAACRRTESLQSLTLFREWHLLQITVRAVRDAWLQISIDRFGGIDQRSAAEGHFIRHSVFASLVRIRLESAALTTLQFTLSSNASLRRDVPGLIGIINDWLHPLKHSMTVADISSLTTDADSDDEDDSESRPTKHRRSIDRGAVKTNVDGRKAKIFDAIRLGNRERTKLLTSELITYQMANGGKRFVSMSLCDLATKAQEVGNSPLQAWFTDQAVEIDPEDGWAWAQHGKSLLNLGRFDKANVAFQNAFDFGTRDTIRVAKTGRAEVLKAQGDLPAALAAFDAVIAQHPEDVVAKTGRAEVLKAQGDLPAALAAFDAVIAQHPEDVVAKTGRASVLVVMGNWDEAILQLSENDPCSRNDWIGFHIRGMISFRRGDLVQAESILSSGAAKCPFADCRGYFETALAVLRLRQGRLSEARELAEKPMDRRWFGPITAVLVHIKGQMEDFASASESFRKLPEPPNAIVAGVFAELERRYINRQPAAFTEDWLIEQEINYLMSC